MNYQFDCKNMPADVKTLFLDSYRVPNNTVVSVYVAEERKLLQDWLLANGANLEDDVTILYSDEEASTEKFNFDGEEDDEDDEDEDEEEAKPKRKVKVREKIEKIDDEMTLDLDSSPIEFNDDSEEEF